MVKKIIIGAVHFYRNYLSIYKLPTCKFHPSCSIYTINSIQKRGVFSGLFKSAWRILRCNPFSKGGYDPA